MERGVPGACRRTLLLELWGLGDAVLMTGALRALLESGRRVTVLCAPPARELLAPSYPEARFFPFRAPWTAFRGKYRLSHWPWDEIAGTLARLRAQRFHEALSVRPDPRDHLLMFLAGAGVRCGFPRGARGLLNHPVARPGALRHRAEDWSALVRSLLAGKTADFAPRLRAEAYPQHDALGLEDPGSPIVALHCGAARPVRRWPAAYWGELVEQLRGRYDFRLLVIADRDGYGQELAPLADALVRDVSLAGLVGLLRSAALFLGNDSGPGHIAAALGVPTVSIFGPQHPELFAPNGEHSRVLAGDVCPHRGCADACHFAEPYCLTRLLPADVAGGVMAQVDQLIERGVLPRSLVPRQTGTVN